MTCTKNMQFNNQRVNTKNMQHWYADSINNMQIWNMHNMNYKCKYTQICKCMPVQIKLCKNMQQICNSRQICNKYALAHKYVSLAFTYKNMQKNMQKCERYVSMKFIFKICNNMHSPHCWCSSLSQDPTINLKFKTFRWIDRSQLRRRAVPWPGSHQSWLTVPKAAAPAALRGADVSRWWWSTRIVTASEVSGPFRSGPVNQVAVFRVGTIRTGNLNLNSKRELVWGPGPSTNSKSKSPLQPSNNVTSRETESHGVFRPDRPGTQGPGAAGRRAHWLGSLKYQWPRRALRAQPGRADSTWAFWQGFQVSWWLEVKVQAKQCCDAILAAAAISLRVATSSWNSKLLRLRRRSDKIRLAASLVRVAELIRTSTEGGGEHMIRVWVDFQSASSGFQVVLLAAIRIMIASWLRAALS